MTPLQQAARDLINRWDSPSSYIAEYIEELRKALDAEIAQAVEPVAVFNGLVDSGEHGAFNLDMLKMIPRGAPLYLHPPQPQATTAVPEGYVLVPIEPTEKMVQAGVFAAKKYMQDTGGNSPSVIYRAMVTAQGEKPQATTLIPDDYVLVPIEPTDEELAKGVRAMGLFVTKNSLIDFSLGYKAMLAAQREKP